jgi:hypothetical protein
VDEYASEDLTALPDARIEEDFEELQRQSDRLECERLRRLAEIHRRRLHERDGHVSAASWLAHRFGVAYGQAADQVRTARALEEMPVTRRAFAAGDVSSSAVRVLASAQEANGSAFARAESMLLGSARTLPIGDHQRVVAYWREAADRRGPGSSDEGLFDRRRLHVSRTIFGMVRVDGDLDPETGQTFVTALRALVDGDIRGAGEDVRTPGQRRADALGELARRFLDDSDRPEVAGERPHLVVTMDVASLSRGAGGAELEDGRVDAATALRLACDAGITRVITRGRSEPLDVGRRTPVVPAAIRRAVVVRDRYCRFPGCGRPQSWCDAHHVVHWAHGGPTALSNLVLLCRRHHRLVHRGWGLAMRDGQPVFSRPDGSVLEERAPP